MALGRRGGERQQEFWMPVQNLSQGPGHVFYDKLNQVLGKAGFDKTLEQLCEPYYAKTGRTSIPPGVYFPTDEELRKFDQQRGKQGQKKVSNAEWESPADPDSRIVKMKDGRTHLGYKAEHVVDLDSEIILSATVHHGTESDTQTLVESLVNAQRNLILAGSAEEIEEVTADKGYHANDTITQCTQLGLRTYIPEPNSPHDRVWTDKPDEVQQAVLNNRRRMRRKKGKQLQRLRSEKVERSFAHICETGRARRTWLRGLEKISKRYLITAAARNSSGTGPAAGMARSSIRECCV